MVSRKKAAGKARKAAKAKAREAQAIAIEDEGGNNQTTNDTRLTQQVVCKHGSNLSFEDASCLFVLAFRTAFNEAIDNERGNHLNIAVSLVRARDATAAMDDSLIFGMILRR